MTPVVQAPIVQAPIVEAIGLAVGRGAAPAVRGIDLAVAPGESVAVVGENGSGKTALLRALAGVDRPRAGSLRWDGGPLPRGPARVQLLGVLFQGEPPSRFTVRELVTLGLALDGPPAPAARRRVDQALRDAGLEALADRSCAALSGGEAQRALLARALVAGPRLLLLDEPTNHLDPAGQAELLGRLDRLRGRVAIVLATHDLGLAARCDRALLLAGGGVVALGPTEGVLTPARLGAALGVLFLRIDDPAGGPPLYRIAGPAAKEAAA